MENLKEIIIALLGSGLIVQFFFYKAKNRKATAEAVTVEYDNKQDMIDWMDARIKQRDEKIDRLYVELRTKERELLDSVKRGYQIELDNKILEVKRCDIRGCNNRQPPSDF